MQDGMQITDLSMINPDISPPRLLIDRLMEAGAKGENHKYAVSRGVRKLREGFSHKYRTTFGVDVCPEREICVTMGTKDALAELFQVIGRPGDRILLFSPTYPAFSSLVRYCGMSEVLVPLATSEQETLLNVERALKHRHVRALVMNYPNNPTGVIGSPLFLEKLIELCQKYDAYIINDFVYGEMHHHQTKPRSILMNRVDKSGIIEIYSLSKGYSVPGWRVGAVLGDSEIVHEVAQLKSLVDYGILLPVQYAAAAALSSSADLVAPIRDIYKRRARTVVSSLQPFGGSASLPEAGCSVWWQIPDGVRGEEITLQAAEKHGIFVMPGANFGAEWDNYIRIALVAQDERLRSAVEALGTLL